MRLTNAELQARYRARQTGKSKAMASSLQRIVDRLDGNDKPLAVELRAMALDGLNA